MSVILNSLFLFILLYSFLEFRRPTTPFAGTRQTGFAAQWN